MSGRRPRARGPHREPRPRTLRTRLVVSSVGLIAVVAAVIGTVTTIALRSHLYEQLNDQVAEIARRASGGPLKPTDDRSEQPSPEDGPFGLITKGGTEEYTVVAEVGDDGWISNAVVAEEQTSRKDGFQGMSPAALDGAQTAAVDAVPKSGIHTVRIPDLGWYQVMYVEGPRGKFYVGLPAKAVNNTIKTLVVVEVSVTAAGLVAAGVAGTAMVGFALRPLRKVAHTATRVSELPLHSGEVTLNERVPESETDPRTEVGQVGAALNRMLDHVHSALHARQENEMRVRQFVADASHELRTPLAAIRGYAELTRRGREETGPDTRHALRRIESESARMSLLVEDLLLLARLDAGRPLRFERTDLVPLVVDTISDARAASRDHVWRLDLPEEPALVSADAPRLQQVLINLLANAGTHTPQGTTVTARVRRRGLWLCVDVEDDGPGIPEELLPHVFERFARGDSSRSRSSGSTGLGLAIVQAVAIAHGGAVTVDSEPGRTVFTVYLPALTPPTGRVARRADRQPDPQDHHGVPAQRPGS